MSLQTDDDLVIDADDIDDVLLDDECKTRALEQALTNWTRQFLHVGGNDEQEFALAEALLLTMQSRHDSHTQRARIALVLCRRLAVHHAHKSYHLSRRELREPFKIIEFMTKK